MEETNKRVYRPLEEISNEMDAVSEQISQLNDKHALLMAEHDETMDYLGLVPKFM